jgi:AraC-like DNA-binding protein
MASEANFSKYHFIRLFKKAYGKAPHQYLIAVRIENAKLLLQSHHSVSETCFAVGFDSPASFSSLFKKMTGLTPSAYQNNHHEPSRAVAAPLKWLPYCYPQNRNFKEAALPATVDL